MARILPRTAPATITSPTRSVPFCTNKVATGPRVRSRLASMTVPLAARSGLATNSPTSETSRIISNKVSRFCPLSALTGTIMVSPPHSSATKPSSESSCLMRSGFAPSLSTLLMATIMGTSAALAWLIASRVWGWTPSSAATTRMARSVTLAPRARMAVKASWPGVSKKTICSDLPLCSISTW